MDEPFEDLVERSETDRQSETKSGDKKTRLKQVVATGLACPGESVGAPGVPFVTASTTKPFSSIVSNASTSWITANCRGIGSAASEEAGEESSASASAGAAAVVVVVVVVVGRGGRGGEIEETPSGGGVVEEVAEAALARAMDCALSGSGGGGFFPTGCT